ncbi:MAG: hypothetical protein V7L04_33135 [Nostoc sp.]|uniref:WD40 repeat domain-containing protein n=1 Tax=Nostoc sp. TaxID=1180 RepID=UPI002FF5B72C
MGCRYRGIHENFGGQTNGVWSAKFTPDEQTLLSSSEDTTIKIWDFETYQCLRTFEGHTRAVISVVSPDDCVLASGATDQTVRIWDMKTGECLRILTDHTRWIFAITKIHSPVKSPILASSIEDQTIRL